jgi:uncharacterized Fe-S center protein
MHTIGEGMLAWDKNKCELCYQCMEICPLDVIKFVNEELQWNSEECWRCGRCERVCQSGGISLPRDSERFMRALAESAKVVLSTFKQKKVIYINFLTEIQPECDCMPVADVPVIQDQGILISDDIVAVEQASVDMLVKSPPLPQAASEDKNMAEGDDILFKLSEKPYHLQIEESEKLGLGTREYELIELL